MKNTASIGNNKLYFILIFLVFWVTTFAQKNPEIKIKQVKNADNTVDFYYDKDVEGSFIVKMKFIVLNNADGKSVPLLNVREKSGLLFRLNPIDKKKRIDVMFSYVVTRGYLNPTIDSTVAYELPFENEKKVKIYWGTIPGISSDRWKKYIVYSKTQDSVFSMRNGIVVEVRSSTKFEKDANGQEINKVMMKNIIVEHADGTFASYSGLTEDSVAVKVGQKINTNDYIGLMEKSTDGRNYNLSFEIYYHEADPEELRGNLVAVNPNFLTQNGIEKLENKREYVVKHN